MAWIPFTDFNKTTFSICMCAPSRYQLKYSSSGAHDESFLNIPAQNAGKLLWYRPTSPKVSESWHFHPCQDSDPCAIIELNHLVLTFFPHPCVKTPICANTPIRAKTPILTVISRLFPGLAFSGRPGLGIPARWVKISMCFVCIFFPFILDIKFVGRTSRGHTGGRSHRISHPPSFCGACLNFSREKDSAIPFPRRPFCRILCVCCVFFPSILDIKFVGRTSRGHTGGRSHRIFNPPSFCGACLDFCREEDSAIPFPRRP